MNLSNHTLILFLLATSALLLSGHVLSNTLDFNQLLLVNWCGWSGTYAIYGIGRIFLKFDSFKEFVKSAKGNILVFIFVIQLIFVLPFLAWFYLPESTFWTFFLILFFGYLYSLSFRIGKTTYVLKKKIFFKNSSIGFSWGALILVGAGKLDLSSESWWLFLFVSIHIFLGSILRDHFDLKQDKDNEVQTLPLYLGEDKSFRFLHVINILTFLFFWLILPSNPFLIVFLVITLYKAFILIGAKRNFSSALWTQTLNIGFNFLVFALILTYKIYGVS